MKTRLLTSVLVLGTLMSIQSMAQSSLSPEDVQITARCGIGLRTYDTAAGQAHFTDLTPDSVQQVTLAIPKPVTPGPHMDMNPPSSNNFQFQVNTPDGLMKVSASINGDGMMNLPGEAQYMTSVSVTVVQDDILVQNAFEQTRVAYGNPQSLLNPDIKTNGVWFTKNYNSSNGNFRQYFANCEYHLKKKTASAQ